MVRPTQAKLDKEQRRSAFAAHWEKQRQGMLTRLKPLVWDDELDRRQVLADNACFMTGSLLLRSSIDLTIVDEDALAAQMLDTAEFYLQTAIERDELSTYALAGQEDLGRAERLKLLTLVGWLRTHRLDAAAFRQALEMKQKWNEAVFSEKDWREMNWSLSEWIAEWILLGEFDEAKRICESYHGKGGRAYWTGHTAEGTLGLVADWLAHPGDEQKGHQAERALDDFYRKITNWGAPGFREAEMLDDERLLYAYIRGKHFKGEDDPIRVIKRMKLSE